MIFPKMLLIVVVKEKMMSFGDESRYQPWLSTCHAQTLGQVCLNLVSDCSSGKRLVCKD